MADDQGFWGIEVGQAGLKALRLQMVEETGKAIATNFDYVPHAKILSQPDAVPDELVATALDTFLSRNKIRGDVIALSVPGQNALARFIQLPPVEQGKVGQIVLYEAKQQIPFALEEVIWDYQRLSGGSEESGYLLEAEVGLFAMKRDLVMQQLQPLINRKVEVELIQVAPLALFNFLCFDRLKIDPNEPFEATDDYTVVCEMGTDNTILVVTNGAKIWIRNVPIGGNHFTRALVKDMKLTFAKAEHLKCNATKSPDPKAVFQAMRPVFNDYVTELQRSIGYFSSVNREAKIVKVLGVGNGFRLAGLQKFLQQHLQYPVERVDRFENLVGEKVLSDDVFRENILSFVVPYGLAVQAMGQTTIHTSLLPPEIATARKIRRKKPWAVLGAACLMGLCSISALGQGRVQNSVSPLIWGVAESEVNDWNGKASTELNQYTAIETEVKAIDDKSNGLVGPLGTREYWLELFRAVNEALPPETAETAAAADVTQKNQVRIKSITSEKMPDLATWFAGLPKGAELYLDAYEADKKVPPTGPGYVVRLTGDTLHGGEGESATGSGVHWVQQTLLHNLHQWVLEQQGSANQVPVGKIGISHAMIVSSAPRKVIDPRNFTELQVQDANPFGARTGAGGMGGGMGMGAGGMGAGGMGMEMPGGGYEGMAPGGGPGMGPGMGAGMGTGMGMRGGGNLGSIINRPNQNQMRQQYEKKYEDITQTTFVIEMAFRPIAHEERTDTRPAATEEEAQAAQSAVEAAESATQAGGEMGAGMMMP